MEEVRGSSPLFSTNLHFESQSWVERFVFSILRKSSAHLPFTLGSDRFVSGEGLDSSCQILAEGLPCLFRSGPNKPGKCPEGRHPKFVQEGDLGFRQLKGLQFRIKHLPRLLYGLLCRTA
jgi:hypothetical protein